MNNIFKKISSGLLSLSLLTACEDGFKSYANDNTARPTLPDINGRNIGDDGTSDKLFDPFYKGPKRWRKESDEDNFEKQTSLK